MVFEEQQERQGQRTEVIDVDHLELLFGTGQDLDKEPNWRSKAQWPDREEADDGQPKDTGSGPDTGKLLRLVSDAVPKWDISCFCYGEWRQLQLYFGERSGLENHTT